MNSLEDRADAVAAEFRRRYDADPDGVWGAPGRVNLIGEHTDYNDGFVLPFALPYYTVIAASATTGSFEGVSMQFPDTAVSFAGELQPRGVEGWAAYPAGVLWSMRQRFSSVDGVRFVLDSDVPTGASLSSSAALECATALALNDIYGTAVAPQALALIAQFAENEFVGVPCGIMDQMASVLCHEGRALFLDTRTIVEEHVPFSPDDSGFHLLVIDTRAPHRLVDGEYALRRKTCEEAARTLGVQALRDISVEQLDDALARLEDDVSRRRVRHIVTENDRVLRAVAFLRAGQYPELGVEMTASHVSLRDDFEVSAPELDAAVDAALEAGAVGARMTGGGFGGCAIALAPLGSVEAVKSTVTQAFAARGFNEPRCFAGTPSRGAHRIR